MTTPNEVSVLFVCLGNICRSPLAEGVFIHLLEGDGRLLDVRVDSAGTGAWHVGNAPDPRSREVAERNGIRLPSRARQVRSEDFHDFDLIVAMDRSNLHDLASLQRKHGGKARLALMRDFDPEPGDGEVPDPYYGGPSGFDRVFEMVLRSARGLLDELGG
ncbi:MAG: low molecular weight phosphotyrosine protein phosphatase [Gemmatimonadales bacterium]|jgi:protein-tyrosine phosphatase|nr:MAG: low molecular weight phosphotyrosine protein phosphatase [Gemmatimonadales bacterium]